MGSFTGTNGASPVAMEWFKRRKLDVNLSKDSHALN
jgi:hypothetical protein